MQISNKESPQKNNYCDDENDLLYLHAEVLGYKYKFYNNNKWKRMYR